MILLAHSSAGRKINRELAQRNINKWVFLGKSYQRSLEYEDSIGDLASRIKLDDSLAEQAKKSRKTVKELFSELAGRFASLEWFALPLAERNTATNDLFLHVCYLSMAKKIIKENDKVCIISESWGVLKVLHEGYPDSCMITDKLSQWKDSMMRYISPLMLYSAFFIRALSKMIIARIYSRIISGKDNDGSKKSVLIFTYIDNKSFGEDGEFKDRYFTVLPGWLKKKGYEVLIFPKICNIQKSLKEACRWLNRGKYIIDFRYYKYLDLLFPLLVIGRQVRLMRQIKDVYYDGLNIDAIISENAQIGKSCESIMYFKLAKRLSERGIVTDYYVDSYENMMPERMFRLGLRRFSTRTKILSYQHSPFLPNLLCMYLSKNEKDIIPDKMVCSSEMMLEVIAKEGFPREKITLGPALRQNYLFDLNIGLEPGGEKKDGTNILVVMPLADNLAEELLLKVFQLFRENKAIKVLIKPHPMMGKETLLKYCRKNRLMLPDNFVFKEEELYSIIWNVNCSLLMSTSALLEIYALGLPYINVGSELSLFNDPTEWLERQVKPVFSISSIKQAMDIILSEKVQPLSGLPLDKLFIPITDAHMEAFLK